MCQLSSTRQFLRSTVLPCLAAAASAKPHCVGSAFRPSSDSDPIEMMPIPCLPASVMPDGLICEATANGISSCNGSNCRAASCKREPVGLGGDALAAEQPADDADRLVLAVAQHHRIDPERVRVRRQRAGPRAEDRASAGHVIELHHALGDVERMVIGQRDHAGRQLDALGALARGGEEHLGRARSSPSRWNGARRTRIRRSRACPGARRDRDRGGTATSGARRRDGAGRGRRRSVGEA